MQPRRVCRTALAPELPGGEEIEACPEAKLANRERVFPRPALRQPAPLQEDRARLLKAALTGKIDVAHPPVFRGAVG